MEINLHLNLVRTPGLPWFLSKMDLKKEKKLSYFCDGRHLQIENIWHTCRIMANALGFEPSVELDCTLGQRKIIFQIWCIVLTKIMKLV